MVYILTVSRKNRRAVFYNILFDETKVNHYDLPLVLITRKWTSMDFNQEHEERLMYVLFLEQMTRSEAVLSLITRYR